MYYHQFPHDLLYRGKTYFAATRTTASFILSAADNPMAYREWLAFDLCAMFIVQRHQQQQWTRAAVKLAAL